MSSKPEKLYAEATKIETTNTEKENYQNSPSPVKVETEIGSGTETEIKKVETEMANLNPVSNPNANSKSKFQNKFTANLWQILNGKIFKILGISLISLVLFAFLTMFSLTPSNFQNPRMDHSHFRLQYIFQGQMEDFGSPRYQVDYIKDVCNGALTESPIHFHDNKGQIVHLHWQKITGGQVLKFYRLNKIGGIDNIMGWKMDDLAKLKLTQIPIHSQSLPLPKGNDKFWVYVGEKDKFEKRNFEDFVKMDLETFFGQSSIIRQNQEEEEKLKKKSGQNLSHKLEELKKLGNIFGLKVQAHGGIDHANETEEQIHLAETQRLENEKKALENRNNNVKSISNSVLNLSNSNQNSTNFGQNTDSSINLLQNTSTNSNSNLTNSNSQNSVQNSSLNSLSNNSQSSQSNTSNSSKTETELKKINNLLGNVVIFVQETEPTKEQVKLRFDNLEPLGDSVCGG